MLFLVVRGLSMLTECAASLRVRPSSSALRRVRVRRVAIIFAQKQGLSLSRLLDHPEDRRVDPGTILCLRPRPSYRSAVIRPSACVLCLDELVTDPPALVLPVAPHGIQGLLLSDCLDSHTVSQSCVILPRIPSCTREDILPKRLDVVQHVPQNFEVQQLDLVPRTLDYRSSTFTAEGPNF